MTDQHVEGVADFIRQVWDPAATPESVRRGRAAATAANPIAPGQDVPTILYCVDGRVVGYLTTIPTVVWSRDHERPAHWMKGFMVLPEFRNGPVGFALVREMARHVGAALALTVQPAAYKLFEALGFRNLGVLTNHVRLLEPGRALARLDLGRMGLTAAPAWQRRGLRVAQRGPLPAILGAAAKGAFGLWTAAGRIRTRGLSVRALDEDLDVAALDRLWRSACCSIAASPSRDGRYLTARYATAADRPYAFATVRERSTLVGLGAVRRPRRDGDPRLGGIRVATLSDIVFPLARPDVGRAVLAGAQAVARRVDADAILCSASHPSLRALLKASAYVPVPGNLYFLARDPGGASALPMTLSDWWLTRGDSHSDETF